MFVSLCENATLMEYLNPDHASFEILVKAITLEFCSPGMEIINQGDQVTDSDHMYFIERGECDVYNKDSLKTESQYGKKIRSLYPSDFFGVSISNCCRKQVFYTKVSDQQLQCRLITAISGS